VNLECCIKQLPFLIFSVFEAMWFYEKHFHTASSFIFPSGIRFSAENLQTKRFLADLSTGHTCSLTVTFDLLDPEIEVTSGCFGVTTSCIRNLVTNLQCSLSYAKYTQWQWEGGGGAREGGRPERHFTGDLRGENLEFCCLYCNVLA